MKMCIAAGNCVSYLCEFVFKSSTKTNTNLMAAVNNMMNIESLKINEMYECVIEGVFTEELGYAWGLCKPLLGIAVIDAIRYEEIKNNIILRIANSLDAQEQLRNAASVLLTGIQQNLTDKNKDCFAKNFGTFKQTLSSINPQSRTLGRKP